MAEDRLDAGGGETAPRSWLRGWASIGALIAVVLLVGLIMSVTLSGRERDEALVWERHAYDVMLLTRTVDATAARSEAALGRFVLDEKQATGTIYYDQWRQAGRQIDQLERLVRGDAAQLARVRKLEDIYRRRGEELSAAATRAATKQASGGLPLFYQAGLSATGPAFRDQLNAIANHEREVLRQRMAQTRMFAEEASNLTGWLGWIGLLIGIGAIVLGIAAYRAIAERLVARREADSEASRAFTLERAVQERTRELRDANERLRAEGAERASAEEKLRQVQKMEAVGQLTGGIAHDFNNMLAVVVGGLDLARRKLRGPVREVEFHLDNAMEGANRAAALTRRLLAFARAEPLMPEAVAPAERISGMLDLLDRALGERIVLQTQFAEGTWNVWVDPHQLENAILNLAVNGRDAMEGQGILTLAIENIVLGAREVGDLPGGEYVRIGVSDTGVGIAPDDIERVFEPFFTTKPVGKGTGLGLSQIFSFARDSGGHAAIESEFGVGTTVTILLPRSGREASAPAAHHPQSARDAESRPDGHAGMAVLVVEDDPRVSRSTVGALEALGYEPIACASGQEALEALARHRGIALVVTDVMMPEMTGPELVRTMAREYADTPVLFVTGYVGEGNDGEELAGHHMLRKPFTVAALADAVDKALADSVSGSLPATASEAAE